MFIIFIKNAFFNVLYFLELFLFSCGDLFYPTKPAQILLSLLNSCIKRLLSDGFNMADLAIKSSLMKSCSPQTLLSVARGGGCRGATARASRRGASNEGVLRK